MVHNRRAGDLCYSLLFNSFQFNDHFLHLLKTYKNLISGFQFSEVTKMEHWPATLIAVVTTYVVVYSLKFYCSSLFFPLKNKISQKPQKQFLF